MNKRIKSSSHLTNLTDIAVKCIKNQLKLGIKK